MIDRRLFLGLGAATWLTPQLALAAAATDRRLVFIILRGAMDGLAAVMPVGDPAYAALRGNFGPPPDAGVPLPLGPDFALHPALAQTGALYARGEALFVHAIASPYRERSHFDAQNVLETGGTAAYARKDGWLNRLLPLLPATGEPAIALAQTLPMALRGTATATAFAPSQLATADDDLLARAGMLYAADPQLHRLWSDALAARTLAGADARGKANPAGLGRLAATFLAKPHGARIAVIELNGWDTHSGQAGRLNAQLRQLDTVIAALKDGLGADWAHTVVIAATEFGRTAAPNGTGGTDHGTGGVAMVAGGAVKGGRVVTDWPGLAPAKLFDGRDLAATTDLRALFAGLAAEHFALDPMRVARRVFAGSVRPMSGLVRG
ncbi:DUF1501 domain-containing protein [Polymorphobacter fuscus]|uniref:DUF1501 domain-containing protein n=1 Tax=Sandarakinorhabdus fusca TaxID=1439888 RepID=A0A7C9KJX4_9SPHN|nr:DUF1501 domain-containing protein [Polymorphobacter fuscus]KAB7644454.1 DUF1501 domain-containing protein [Polymorphobacter fuscus]MQT18379.1 DUF1501 domain-containing protein [Polymorphobacter fuscus]NJC08279.1 uncharacterized protein (DUF1501 family) [Polymorphobacter fuscus]